jgi:hypothetical protein
VIPDENEMNLFLKYLIRKVYTVDGKKGSAKKLVDL